MALRLCPCRGAFATGDGDWKKSLRQKTRLGCRNLEQFWIMLPQTRPLYSCRVFSSTCARHSGESVGGRTCWYGPTP